MGLTRLLVALATQRPRCYVVEAPGGAATRMDVERELDARGWRTAWSPAAADVLVIAGELPSDLSQAADLLWSQLPGPRARVAVTDAGDVGEALDGARLELSDEAAQRRDASSRSRDEVERWVATDGEMDHSDMDHSDMDHSDMDHGDMDHGDMEMAPGGIALAEGAEDRDGLEMDVLVHPLGPLLDRWPGELELLVTLHGDVVAEAEAKEPGEWARSEDLPFDVRAWDAVATTLSLIADERGAREARRLRAAAYDGTISREAAEQLRSRLQRLGRWAVLPDRVVAVLLGLTSPDAAEAPPARVTATELVAGHDLADVRLLIASHAPLLRLASGQEADRD